MPDELRQDRLFGLRLGDVNAYLVDDGEVTLVDAGMPGDLAALQQEMERAGYTPEDLDRILVTHYDLDHVGTLAALPTEAPVYALDPDAGFLDGIRRPPLLRRKGLLQRAFGRRIARPSTPVCRLEDGEDVGGFTAHHTPGHTPGHAVYHHRTLDVALLGDLVVADDGALRPPAWYFAYSPRQNRESVRTLAARDLGFVVAAPGHGRPITTGGAAALSALAERLS